MSTDKQTVQAVMSDVFHKSCYTARSSGYKYRTLSTNTGDKKRRDSKEDTTFHRKFDELKNVIVSKIDDEVALTQKARLSLKTKFEKIDAKISTMLDLQDTVSLLRKDLNEVEKNLIEVVDRVQKLDSGNEYMLNLPSKKTPFIRSHTTLSLDSTDRASSITRYDIQPDMTY